MIVFFIFISISDINTYIIARGMCAPVLRDMGTDRHYAHGYACKEFSRRCTGTSETAARKLADVAEARSRLGDTDSISSHIHRTVRYRRHRRAAKRF